MVSRQMQCTISKINPKLPSQIFSSYFFFLFFSNKSGKNGQQILFSINQCKGFDSLNYNRIFAFKQIFWFRNSSYKHSYISRLIFKSLSIEKKYEIRSPISLDLNLQSTFLSRKREASHFS